MKILGLSFYYHDAAAVLVIDGAVVAMSEEERFSRRKHDAGYPERAIAFVLEQAGISAGDLDHVVYYEKPFHKFDRLLKSILGSFPRTSGVWRSGIKKEIESRLWVRQTIAERLGIPPEKVLFSGHHLSHAAAAFLPSPFERAAVLTVDGVGEWATTTLGVGEGGQVTFLKELHFPHSLGLLYSAFTAFLGFEVNEGEYKVMGMAPYGRPTYADKVRKLLRAHEDGSFELDMSYFSFDRSLTRTYTRKFEKLFGDPRDPKAKFFTRATGWPSYFGPRPAPAEEEALALREEHYADIAASVQLVLEERLVALAREAHRLTGADALCIGGGVALNSVANWKIVQQTPFKRLFIQPAAGDAGGALGAALAVAQLRGGVRTSARLRHAYYGKAYRDEEIVEALRLAGVPSRALDDEALFDDVAQALADGAVVGWYAGRFEWGPRALGARSILADPRRAEMKDIVNTKIKFREPYRPFAPSVLAAHAETYFDLPDAAEHEPARYMLFVVPVRPERRAEVPAITHVDGSARPQLVFPDTSPRYHALIDAFRRKTGVPMVMNTSFNLKGEPIVDTPLDALRTFARSEMDVLVLERHMVRRSDIPADALERLAAVPVPSPGRGSSRLLKGLALAAVATLAMLAVLEIGVRLFTKPVYPILRSDPEIGTIHERGVARHIWNGEADRETFVKTNALGYIGDDWAMEKPEGALRVAFMGDSMTEGLQVDHERTFVYLLEQALNVSNDGGRKRVELMNYGVGGHGAFLQYQTYKKNVAPYAPDAVFVMFHANDFADDLAKSDFDPERYRNPGARHGLKSFLLMFQLPKYLYAKLNGSAAFLSAVSKAGLVERNASVATTEETWWGDNEDDPDFYAFTFDVLKRFRDRVEADGGMFVVATMPDELEYAAPDAWHALRYNRKLEEFLERENIAFINVSNEMAESKAAHGDCLSFGCGGHLKEIGHEAMARALFPHLAVLARR